MGHFIAIIKSNLRLFLLAALIAAPLVNSAAGAAAAPITAASAVTVVSTATGCQWTYYPIIGGKLQPQQLLFNDPDNTPIGQISLGSPFKGSNAKLSTTGSIDIDKDNLTDVFRTVLRSDGFLQWQFSSGGTAPWADLAYTTTDLPLSELRFGDFDANGNTDVFASQYNNAIPGYQWLDSAGGNTNFVTLNSVKIQPSRLELGDFNGDGVTDVFTTVQNGNSQKWAYYPGGKGSAVPLNNASTDPSLLRFGDFNGDGITDVFAATQLPDGSYQWLVSYSSTASYTNLNTSTVPYSELMFGDFNGDGITDVLAPLPQPDGTLKVEMWSGGLGPAVILGSIAAPAPALRVGDFNGDGNSDLWAYRCGMAAPLTTRPLQTLALANSGTINRPPIEGDLNGDGLSDVIFVSTCQIINILSNCATHHLMIGAGIAAKNHIFHWVPATESGSALIDYSSYKAITGDFNGDGKTDLALIHRDISQLTIDIAFSNGDGTFTLAPPQVFGGEAWSEFNPLPGDFNGDGKTDLGFTTVCAFFDGSCGDGDNNSVYVATSTGGGAFTLGARQDFSQTGWGYFVTFRGDFNGDGKDDLVFNTTCRKVDITDSTCTAGNGNLVYTALSTGHGSFTLSPEQVYGTSDWSDYYDFAARSGDVNGDGRTDIVWSSVAQKAAKTNNNQVVVGTANPDGTFQLSAVQNFGSAWSGNLSLADFNQDGKADLVWNLLNFYNSDVDMYAVALSNGASGFKSLGPGSVFTGEGYFEQPDTSASAKLPASLTLVSTTQDTISSATFVVQADLVQRLFLPEISKK